MPIYEYRCERCGHEMETMQKMSDPALTTCPQCKEEALRKLISAAGFQLKGSGWYVTDFKGNKKNPESKTDKTDKTDKTKNTEKTEKTEEKSSATCGQGACPACTD